MIKKLFAFILCFISVAAVFSGCNLISTNTAKVLATVVAEVKIDNETIQITKQELYTGYTNYGADLVEKGSTVEEAVKETVDLLINRQIMLYKAKQLVVLSEAQQQEVWRNTYDSLNSNLKTFEDEIIDEKGIVVPENPSTEDETLTVYTPYKNLVELVNNDGIYSIVEVAADEEDEPVLEANFVSGANGFHQVYSTETLGILAMNRYIKQLKANEEGKNLSTVDSEVWEREVNRIQESTLENLYLTEYEALYEAQFDITLENLVNKYISLVRKDYLNYATNSDHTDYYTAAKEAINTIYYHPVQEFFKVTHILIKYSDAQTAEITAAKARRDAGYISNAEYDSIVENLTNAIRATEKDAEGNVVEGSTPLASEILASLQSDLTGKSFDEQTAIFNNYIYRFNQDGGIMNASIPYVVGLTQSAMVEAFTASSRELSSDNVLGAVSDLVTTEYGVHIIMYLGKVENLVTISDLSTFDESSIDIENVFNSSLYDLNTKTMLDQIYELVKTSTSTAYSTMLINQYRANCEITKFESRYSNLWS